MQSILITGGCGFIGSHTCISFLKKGYKLYIIDSNSNSSSKVLDKICQFNETFEFQDFQCMFLTIYMQVIEWGIVSSYGPMQKFSKPTS